MKVALNGTALLSPLTGLGQYTHHLAQGLMEHSEVDLVFFYGNRWGVELQNSPLKGIVGVKSLAKRFLPNPYALNRFLQQRVFNHGIRIQKPQIYHEPNFIAFESDIPSIVTVHDLSWIRFPDMHPEQRVRAMNTYFEKGLQRASLVLTDSHFVKQELIEVFGVPSERIQPVLLGVDKSFHPKSKEQTQSTLDRFSLKHDSYLVAVGTLEPRKNLQSALSAFMQFPQSVRQRFPLVLVGMKGWHTSELEAQLSPLIRAGEVRELGYLSRNDLIDVVAGALTLIYPSIYEGFGLPPLEAMACGVPVITSNVSSIPEVVGDAGIMLDPHDIDGFSDAMQRLIDDANLRAELSSQALNRSKDFTWGRCAEQTLAAYRKALAGSSNILNS